MSRHALLMTCYKTHECRLSKLMELLKLSPMLCFQSFVTSGYVNLHPIRNLYLISNTLGTYNPMAINGEWGILKKIPVSADYNQLIYDQTVLGMDYLDCSNQTLSLIDFKLKDHSGNAVNLHGGHVSFSIIFVKVADE